MLRFLRPLSQAGLVKRIEDLTGRCSRDVGGDVDAFSASFVHEDVAHFFQLFDRAKTSLIHISFSIRSIAWRWVDEDSKRTIQWPATENSVESSRMRVGKDSLTL